MFVFYGLPPLWYNLATVRLLEATSTPQDHCLPQATVIDALYFCGDAIVLPQDSSVLHTHTYIYIYILNSNFHSKPRLLLPSIKAARPFHSSSVQENWPHHRQQHHLCIFESFVAAVWLLFQRHGICYVIWSIHSSLQSTSHQYLYPWFAICPCHTTTWFVFIHF